MSSKEHKRGKQELTALQMAFVDCYMESFNATLAYCQCGYKTEGMKRSSINRLAFEVFHNPKVQAEINRRLEEVKISKNIMTEKLITEALKIIDFEADAKLSDKMKAMEFLMKLYSLGGDNVNVKSEGELTFNIEVIGVENE